MPIYEFYCSPCNTVFSFFSAAVDTRSSPACPKCKRPGLERKPSTFALGRGRHATADDDELGGLGDTDLERLVSSMDDELARLGDGADDPRNLARALRRLGGSAGFEPGPKLESLIARLEAGHDPDSIEAELGEELDGDEALTELFRRRGQGRARARPRVDDTLHFL